MQIHTRIVLLGAAAITSAIGFASPASAQATRTWVSGVGNDADPCSRTAPCKTFAGAILKTAAGGEINCLDPAGFGAVTIQKSLTISCPYTEGGALAGGNGIVVSLPLATDSVFLRGLDIFGVSPPSNGVRMTGLGSLHIEDTVIRRFNAANSFGVSIAPSGAAKLYMTNVTIANNGNGATGGGILIDPTGSGSVRAKLTNVRVRDNANVGLLVDTVGNTGFVAFDVSGSDFTGNVGKGVSAVGGAEINGMVNDSAISHNVNSGIESSGALVTLRVGNTTIVGNSSTGGTAVNVLAGSAIRTYGNNRVDGNLNDGAFTPVALPEK